MQRNCHEFIAYENLVGSRRGSDRRHTGPVTLAPVEQALPLVRRALKVLTDREVTPQLGLLKSTLLQLDSTFSERTYGVNSFRDFAQKLAAAGHVTLREHGRNVLVELRDGAGPAPASIEEVRPDRREPEAEAPPTSVSSREAQEPRAADGVREVRRIFLTSAAAPRWPMYIRQAKQFMRNVDPTFDERKFGFGSLVDLLRAAQREGLFRMERDRQGSVRLFPGPVLQQPAAPQPAGDAPAMEPMDDDNRGNVEVPHAATAAWSTEVPSAWPSERPSDSGDVVEAAAVQEIEVAPVVDAEELPAAQVADEGKPARSRRAVRPARTASRKTAEPDGQRPRKRAPRVSR
jgi:hypothetical protein